MDTTIFGVINREMKKPLLLVAVLGFFYNCFSQQDAQYSMYRFNGLYVNPAYSGSHDALNAMAIYRHQWIKIPGLPQSASVAIHSPLKNERLALGLVYNFDKIGIEQTHTLSTSFAYRLPVGKKKKVKLCFGLSAGVAYYQAKLNSVNVVDAGDPNFETNVTNRWLPNVGFGVYAYSDRFFAGISVPHILANKLNGNYSAFYTRSDVAHQYHHLLITGGYVFNIGKKVKFMPSMLLKYVPTKNPVSFDFNIAFIFIDRIWLGAGYRFNDSYNFLLAVNVTPQLRIGYCYDLTVNSLNKYTSGSHEVMISYDALFKHSKVVSPRYVKYF